MGVAAELLRLGQAVELVHLAPDRQQSLGHGEARAAAAGALQAGIERRRADVAAGQLELRGEKAEIEIGRIGAGGERLAPDALALDPPRQRKLDDVTQPTHEGLVEVLATVGGERSEERRVG